ncbi:MAG: hypothetical protein VCE75_26135 [Alphaproteobacteria bacterium]
MTECAIARFPPICLAVAVAGRAGAANRRRISSSVKALSLLLSSFSNFDLDLHHSPRLIPPSPLVSFFRMIRDDLSSDRMVTCVERVKTNTPMSKYAHMLVEKWLPVFLIKFMGRQNAQTATCMRVFQLLRIRLSHQTKAAGNRKAKSGYFGRINT